MLYATLGVFVLALGYLISSSLVSPEVLVFDPSPTAAAALPADTVIHDTITVDARDPNTWRFVDLDRRTVVTPPDTAGWDLALRRFSVVPADAAIDLGPVPFDSVPTAPAEGYLRTILARDTTNAATERWYSYSMLTHLLTPTDHTYALRNREGRYAKLQFLGYYCSEMAPGCLTFRYVFQPDGSRSFR